MNTLLAPLLLGTTACWSLAGAATVSAMIGGDSRWKELAGRGFLLAGILLLAGLVAGLWLTLDRPPLRTLGETRLWYALLLPTIGLLVEWRLGTRMLRLPMLAFGLLFVAINLARPGSLDRTLMPALQSPWFVPHVVVYMVAYAALGLSCGAALWALTQCWWRKTPADGADLWLPMLLVRIGLPFLTLGLLFGALWAKEAWGHYWTWDPKETWAFLTWAVYLGVHHGAPAGRLAPNRQLQLISLAFLVVLACWFLVNYLPSAQVSVHTYTRQ